MASLEKRNGIFRVVFRFSGQKFRRSLKTRDEKSANLSLARLEDNLRRLELGTFQIPAGADIPSALLSSGEVDSWPTDLRCELESSYFTKAQDLMKLSRMQSNYQSKAQRWFDREFPDLKVTAAPMTVQRVTARVAHDRPASSIRHRTSCLRETHQPRSPVHSVNSKRKVWKPGTVLTDANDRSKT